MNQARVRAACGIPWRRGRDGEPEVALVHRPKYDDWSFPKGKLLPGEDERAAALREVEEETGLRCHLGRPLGRLAYADRLGRPKSVTYWELHPVGGRFARSAEIDQMCWLPADEAGLLLTGELDRRLLGVFMARRRDGGGGDAALYVIRHAEAGDRTTWTAADHERPVSALGGSQSDGLAGLLAGAGIGRLLCSPYLRCLQTLEPLAERTGLPIEIAGELAEGIPPASTMALVGRTGAVPAVLCSHGDVIEALIDGLIDAGMTVPARTGFQKGSTWVLRRDEGVFTEGWYVSPVVPIGAERGALVTPGA